MKPRKITPLYVLLAIFLAGAIAQAQPVTQSPQDPRLELELELQLLLESLNTIQTPFGAFQARAPQGGGGRGSAPELNVNTAALSAVRVQVGGAWWTNTALVERLGLTNDQKSKIERAFENHRQNIASSTALLEREETQLARLLEAEPMDRNAVLTQTDRVIQARGEMERANSAMTLEMRESLTRAQWLLLQSSVGARGGARSGQRQQ